MKKYILFRGQTVQCCPNGSSAHSLMAVGFLVLNEKLEPVDEHASKIIELKHDEYLVKAEELENTQGILDHHKRAITESTARSHLVAFFNTYRKGDGRLTPIAFELESEFRHLKAFFPQLLGYFDKEDSGLNVRQFANWLHYQGKLEVVSTQIELAERLRVKNKKPGQLKNDLAVDYKIMRKLLAL